MNGSLALLFLTSRARLNSERRVRRVTLSVRRKLRLFSLPARDQGCAEFIAGAEEGGELLGGSQPHFLHHMPCSSGRPTEGSPWSGTLLRS